jgi:hypothetical protein
MLTSGKPGTIFIAVATKTRGRGHPPTGLRGEKVSDYHQLTIRVPAETAEQLAAASSVLRRPRWRIVVDALAVFVGAEPGLSDEEKRAVRQNMRLHGKGGE